MGVKKSLIIQYYIEFFYRNYTPRHYNWGGIVIFVLSISKHESTPER